MLISKAMTVKDSGEELQMRAIELDGEGWIQIAQDKSRGMYSRSGAEKDQPRHFQGCRAGVPGSWGSLFRYLGDSTAQSPTSHYGPGDLAPALQTRAQARQGGLLRTGWGLYLCCDVGCENLIIWGPGRPKSQLQGMTEHSVYMKSSSSCSVGERCAAGPEYQQPGPVSPLCPILPSELYSKT